VSATADHSTVEETIYTHNLEFAKQFFTEKLKPQTTLYTKLTQRLLFNSYTISNDIDVFVAFETMNNRGKALSHPELLKNRLIFLSTKFHVDKEERSRLRRVINESWKTIYHFLGKNKNRPLDDNVFLRMHFLMFFFPHLKINPETTETEQRLLWRYRRDDHYKDYLLDAVFTSRNLTVSPEHKPVVPPSVDYIYAYAHDIKKAVKLYYEVTNSHDSSFSDQEKMLLEKIRRGSTSDSLLLLLAAYSGGGPLTAKLRFLALLERVQFFQMLLTYPHRIDSDSLVLLAAKMARKDITLNDVITQLENTVDQMMKGVELGSVFGEWVKRYGAYGWRGIKYFLFEYEQELKARSRTSRDKLTWEEFARENFEEDYSTVEHIYP
jgi:hypothetical protein